SPLLEYGYLPPQSNGFGDKASIQASPFFTPVTNAYRLPIALLWESKGICIELSKNLVSCW
ncbi:MAG: hypothetical protein P8Z00_20665, partial [Anaerolineales bacterium]